MNNDARSLFYRLAKELRDEADKAPFNDTAVRAVHIAFAIERILDGHEKQNVAQPCPTYIDGAHRSGYPDGRCQCGWQGPTAVERTEP